MQTFNSKIILFGEYTLLKGSMGLAIPFPKFSGKWSKPKKTNLSKEQRKSNDVILGLVAWIPQLEFYYPFRLEILKNDVAQGLYFESNIPQGYGLGSSGALVAALYQNYFQIPGKPDLVQVTSDLARVESYFHGKSSGTDPLVSFLNQTLFLNPKFDSQIFNIPKNLTVFLIDTGKLSSTKGLVATFLEKSEREPLQLKEFIERNNQCIQTILLHPELAFTSIQQFCQFEQQFLPAMFPDISFINEIEKDMGLNLCIKLCGSGGGGFLLGFAYGMSYSEVEKYFLNKAISTIEINNSFIKNKKMVQF